MKRTAIASLSLLLLVPLLVGCGSTSTMTPTAPSPTPALGPATPAVQPTSTATATSGTMIPLQVWFAFMPGGNPGGPYLFQTRHPVEQTEAIATAATAQLLGGPTSAEKAAGLSTAIPAGTKLLHISIATSVATVDLSKEFTSGGGSASMFMRVAQVVYTETQFHTVTGVRFKVEGKLLKVLGGEGIILNGPQTRAMWRDQLPPILVTSPWIAQRVTSPMRVAGSANVFEATVSIKVVAGGNVLLKTTTMASCGTGCRGTFSKLIGFNVGADTRATVLVYEVSARNGNAINVVRIPVTLAA